MKRLRGGVWSAVTFFALCGCIWAWSLALPSGSAPDEPAHVYRAESLWRGQFLSKLQARDGSWVVEVSNRTVYEMERATCTRFRPEVTANCVVQGRVDGSPMYVNTGAGRYLPLYYYAVGWPSLFDDGMPGVLAMRIVSGLGCAGLMFSALRLLRRAFGPELLPGLTFLALTPQTLWMSSVVNPNSWEIAAGLLVWAAGICYVVGKCDARDPGPRNALVVGIVCLLLMRRLGPLWLLLILGSLAMTWMCLPAPKRSARFISTRALITHTPWVLALAAVSVYWHSRVELGPALSVLRPDAYWGHVSLLGRAHALAPQLWEWTRQFYGITGWLDARSPAACMLLWGLAAMATAIGALWMTASTKAFGMLTAIGLLGTFVIPVVLSVVMGPTVGLFVWQGRYQMPYSQGLVWGLACIAVLGRDPFPRPAVLRLVRWAAVLLAGAGACTFAAAMHRYTNGMARSWNLTDPAWSPLLGVEVSLILGFGSVALLLLALVKDQELSHGIASVRPVDGVHLETHVVLLDTFPARGSRG